MQAAKATACLIELKRMLKRCFNVLRKDKVLRDDKVLVQVGVALYTRSPRLLWPVPVLSPRPRPKSKQG